MRALGGGLRYDAERRPLHGRVTASGSERRGEPTSFTCAVRRIEGGCDWFAVRVDRRAATATAGCASATPAACSVSDPHLIATEPCGRRPRHRAISRRRARLHRSEAPLVRPEARRALRRGCRRGGQRLAGRPARGRRRAARLRLPAQPPRAPAGAAERLEAGLPGRPGGALPRRRRLRGADQRARDPLHGHRPQRPAPLESLGAALGARAISRRPRRPVSSTASGSARPRPSTGRSSTATRRAPRSPPPRSSRR